MQLKATSNGFRHLGKKIFLNACVLTTLIIDFFPTSSLSACSRVFWHNEINVMTARTMDLVADEDPTIRFFPRGLVRNGHIEENSLQWQSKYGSIVITAFDDESVSEGMNEKGLSARVLYLTETQYENDSGKLKLCNGLWVQYLIDNFASVKEAVNALNTFQVVSRPIGGEEWPLHACMEDPSGDSAIIEFIKGKMVVHHGPQHAVMTNDPPYSRQLKSLKRYKKFGGSLPLPEDLHSEHRFVKCAALLKDLPRPQSRRQSFKLLHQLISEATISFDGYDEFTSPTRWISITDNTHLIYHFISTIAANHFWIDLREIDFSQGQPYRHLYPHSPYLNGKVCFFKK